MRVEDFNYELPKELIAQYPLPNRSASRLLCLSRTTGQVSHQQFSDIINFLNPGDLLVFNNTKVIPARLFAKKETGGQCEILVERMVDDFHCWAHIRASKSPRVGSSLHLNDKTLTVDAREDALFFLSSSTPISSILSEHGHMPLPPYMEREDEALDQERYQTVYAQIPGAVAAPTAGLHFDHIMLEKLREKGVQFAEVTLHVGAGTFQPIRVENVADHKMHYETVEVTQEVCDQIKKTKEQGGRVIAVGTTSARSLETAALNGKLAPFSGETNLFITPGFHFHVIDALLTNFHLPKSTLLMLVSAFSSREAILSAYQSAIQHHYRFFSYGDAMVIY